MVNNLTMLTDVIVPSLKLFGFRLTGSLRLTVFYKLSLSRDLRNSSRKKSVGGSGDNCSSTEQRSVGVLGDLCGSSRRRRVGGPIKNADEIAVVEDGVLSGKHPVRPY
jgi:hypothetical protein